MFLAHNNPYDVVAGHAIARAAGAVVTDYAGAPLTLDSTGAMAAVPGIHAPLIALATRPRRRARTTSAAAPSRGRAALHPVRELASSESASRVDHARSPSSASRPARPNVAHARLADRLVDLLRREPHEQVVRAHHAHGHVARGASSRARRTSCFSTTSGRDADDVSDAFGEVLASVHPGGW